MAFELACYSVISSSNRLSEKITGREQLPNAPSEAGQRDDGAHWSVARLTAYLNFSDQFAQLKD